MVFANHAHVYPASLLTDPSTPQHYRDYAAKGTVTIDDLLRTIDDLQVDRVVAFPPLSTPERHPDFNASTWLAGEIRDQSRVVGYGTVRFHEGNLDDQIKEIRDLGFRGIKVHASVQKIDLGSEQAYALYESCQRHNILVDAHTGPHGYRLSHDSDPHMFDEVMWSFPELRMVFEHFAGWAFFREICAVIAGANTHRREPRAFGGLTPSNILPLRKGGTRPDLTNDDLMRVVEYVGPEAVIVGLDFPHHSNDEYRLLMDTVRNLPLSEAHKNLMLGGNVDAILRQ